MALPLFGYTTTYHLDKTYIANLGFPPTHIDSSKYPVYFGGLDGKGNGFCSFRTINRGVFVNDLGRRKATGMPFEYSGVIDLQLRDGKIVRADEWLRVPFEDSVSASDYIVMSEETLKEVMRKELHDE